MTVASYIIHLERAEERLTNTRKLRAALGPRAQIVPAVDGATLCAADLAPARGAAPAPRYPFDLRPAEVATFLSHRACWQRLTDEGHEAALIVEDDVALAPEFHAACDLALANLPARSLVRFPCKQRERGTTMASQDEVRLFRPRVVSLGMQAQIVTRGAAERLLAASGHFDRPVDTFMQISWMHGVDVLSVWPSGVSEVSAGLGGSTIHETKLWGERFRREIRRPFYRLAVRLQSHWHRNDA